MRILHVVTRSEFGGAQSIVRSLAESRSAHGDTVAVAAGNEGSWEAFAGMDRRIECIPVPDLVRAIKPVADFRAIASLASLYRRWNPDIVHLHTSKAGALGRCASGGLPRRNIVYTMHGYDQIRTENRKMLPIDRLLASRCGAVVAVSAVDAEAMRADGYRVELIPNGVPASRSLPPEADEEAVSAAPRAAIHRLRADRLPIVIVVARDARPKRIDLARDMAIRLAGKAHIVWIGGGSAPGDPTSFHALGTVPDAASLFPLADIFLLTSDHEGMPLSLLEAMAAGLPVIASRTGGIPEALNPDGDGRASAGFVLPNEGSVMAAALERLVSDTRLREAMGAAARSLWKTRYSSDIMTEAYCKLYHRLLSEQDEPR